MNAIRPANSIKVELTDKETQAALVVVPDSELSLAIGKEGQNARLATKLTGWQLDIEGENGNSPRPADKEEVDEVDGDVEE